MKAFLNTKLKWIVLAVLAAAVVLAGLFTYQKFGWAFLKFANRQNFDSFSVAYRSDEKAQTILGKLPRPVRALYKDGSFIGLTTKDSIIQIPVSGVTIDPQFEVLFDVYSDKVYYVNDGSLFYFDVKSQTNVPVMVNGKNFTVSSDDKLSGVHNEYLAIEKSGGYAGTDKITVYDLRTGEPVASTTIVGYDISRAYIFNLNGKKYQLIVDSKGGSHSGPTLAKPGYIRTVQTQDDNMRFYLYDDSSSAYVVAEKSNGDFSLDDPIMDAWNDIVFTITPSMYFNGKTPFYTLKTAAENNDPYDVNKFSVRNFYQLDYGSVGLEVNDGLIVINLDRKTAEAEYITDATTIENILKDAILLGSDENDYHNRGYCADDKALDDKIFTNGYLFSYCML